MGAQLVAGTGHRPNKLGGYGPDAHQKLLRFARRELYKAEPTHVVSGMALGWDQALAAAACELGVPWTAAVPFKGQERVWPPAARDRYLTLLAKAAKVVYVTQGNPRNIVYAMNDRNHWMVMKAKKEEGMMLALWNGSPGGTGNCVSTACTEGVTVLNVWDRWLKFQ